MVIQLINGQFSIAEATEIITQMMHVKIKYHENKINAGSNEEDIKIRETKIKQLQKNLFEMKESFLKNTDTVTVMSFINIE